MGRLEYCWDAIGGIIAIGLEDLSFSSIKFHGDVAALLAAASFGLYLLVLEQLKNKFCIDEIVGWSSAIAAGLTAPIVVLGPEHLLPLSWQGWFSIVSLVIICQILRLIQYYVVVMPQNEQQETTIVQLLPELTRYTVAQGSAYHSQPFYSKEFAKMFSDQYRTLDLFSLVTGDL